MLPLFASRLREVYHRIFSFVLCAHPRLIMLLLSHSTLPTHQKQAKKITKNVVIPIPLYVHLQMSVSLHAEDFVTRDSRAFSFQSYLEATSTSCHSMPAPFDPPRRKAFGAPPRAFYCSPRGPLNKPATRRRGEWSHRTGRREPSRENEEGTQISRRITRRQFTPGQPRYAKSSRHG